ncbi:MAG: redoxin domain-containing protein [Candidatus Paceibacterota bacterium]|jgi:peroxiredoxin (alkyl hydroperoxide reductase subunit C)
MHSEDKEKACSCTHCFSGGVGEKVPSYKLKTYQKEDFKDIGLDEYRGKWLVLFFYPADFTFICPTELEEMAGKYEEFKKIGAEIVSVSTDTVFTHKAWHDTSEAIKKITFPMASDKDGELSRMFGTYIYDGGDAGLSLRGTFIIDPEGIIRSVEINDNSIGRSAKELYRKLQAAKYVHDHGGKQVCPAGWEPGDETLTPGIDLVGKI